MKRTIKVDRDEVYKNTFKVTVLKDSAFSIFYGLTDVEAIGRACIYLNGILDSDGKPEYIADIVYSDALIGTFKNH